MLKRGKLTARQSVMAYAAMNDLAVSGTESRAWITLMDKRGHWSEAWTMAGLATWAQAEQALLKIEQAYSETLSRPWEDARQRYTGVMA